VRNSMRSSFADPNDVRLDSRARSIIANEKFGTRNFVRNATPVDKMGRTVPLKAHDDWRDRLKGQCALFFFFLLLIILIVLFFTFVPLYSAPSGQTRDMGMVRSACPSF